MDLGMPWQMKRRQTSTIRHACKFVAANEQEREERGEDTEKLGFWGAFREVMIEEWIYIFFFHILDHMFHLLLLDLQVVLVTVCKHTLDPWKPNFQRMILHLTQSQLGWQTCCDFCQCCEWARMSDSCFMLAMAQEIVREFWRQLVLLGLWN